MRRHRKRPRLLSGATFDYDRTRFCVPCKTGIACYRGALDSAGEWTGKLVGVATCDAEARRFLEGALVRFGTERW